MQITDLQVSKEDSVLKIVLPSALTKKNASPVFEKINSYMDENITAIEINAEELRSLTAEGLDVLVELKKKCRDISFGNARMGVCDVFDSFGFKNLVKITKKYRFVSVEGCRMIARGGHGAIYKLEEDSIIKVYIDHSPLEIIENERRFARNAFLNGIPTAIAYDVVETEYGYGVIFEMLNGTTLGKHLKEHPEDTEKYAAEFADLLVKLNGTYADDELFDDFQDIYRSRITMAKKPVSEKDIEKLVSVVDMIPKGTGMIHGDYHPNNVMLDADGNLMLIDMADISRGNGIFDIGNTYMLMHAVAKVPLVNFFATRATGVSAKTCMKIWDVLIKRYYHTDDKQLIKQYTKTCSVMAGMRMAVVLGMPTGNPPIVNFLISWFVKLFIVPKTEKYKKILKESFNGSSR